VAELEFPLVEAYLGTFQAELGERTPGRERILAEAEDHLRTATAHALADGLSLEAAQRWAIARFGPPDVVAAAFLRIYGLPRVFDARGGLPVPAVDELRRTTCIALAPLNQWLAVLGYWVPESDGMRFGAILLRSLSQLAVDQGPVLLDKPERIPEWRTGLLASLRPGMHLQAQQWEGEWRLWYDAGLPPAKPGPRLEELIGASTMRHSLRRLHTVQPLSCLRVKRPRSAHEDPEPPG
jgi:hypothetical protein